MPDDSGASLAHAPPVGEHPLAALARTGLDPATAELRDCALTALTAETLPCVALLSDGTGLALTAAAEGGFVVTAAAGDRFVALDALAARFAGRLLAPPAMAPALAPSYAASALDGSLPRLVLRRVLAARTLPLLLLAALLGNVFVFVLPTYSMVVYDRIIPHRATETLIALTIGVVIVCILDLITRTMRGQLQEAIGIDIGLSLQWALFQRVLAVDFAKAPRQTGIVTNAFAAAEGAAMLAPALVAGALVDLPFLLLTLVYVGFLAQWVVLPPILAIVAVVAVNFVAHLRSRRAHLAVAGANLARQNRVEDLVHGLAAIKTTASARETAAAWIGLVDDIAHHGHAARVQSAAAGQATGMILQLNTVACLAVGVFMVAAGGMTVGALVAAVLLTSRAIAPVTALAGLAVRATGLAAAADCMKTLQDLPCETTGDGSRLPQRLMGAVRFSAVTLRYPGEPRPALSQIDVTIAPGAHVGVIGRIGSGKSSLVHMLNRLYQPETGSLLLDEHDIRQFDPEWLRRRIAFMAQDCELFDGSIRDNIVRGLAHVDEAAFDAAASISGVKDIVAAHPHGYGLVVGRNGRRLSGGERQAVCLARALARDSDILVLDEPTAAMDNQLERQVVERLRPVLAGKTVIVATHRAPVLALVDRVIWLDGGRVIADGPRDEILRRLTGAAA